MPDAPRPHSPTEAEASRRRQQGAGFGQRDETPEMEARTAESPVVEDLDGGPEDLPEGADQYDFAGQDNPLEDGGDPSGGMQQGVDHTRWGVKTEAERGQGRKTRQRTKEIIKGGLSRR